MRVRPPSATKRRAYRELHSTKRPRIACKGRGGERLANTDQQLGETPMNTSTAAGIPAAQPAFLSKERIIAKPGF
ncbi:hypothetical protein ACQXZZ_11895, partial [Corynebacterium diphtheriae]